MLTFLCPNCLISLPGNTKTSIFLPFIPSGHNHQSWYDLLSPVSKIHVLILEREKDRDRDRKRERERCYIHLPGYSGVSFCQEGSLVCWYMPVKPAFQNLSQKSHKF
jgi:hypothetical protein